MEEKLKKIKFFLKNKNISTDLLNNLYILFLTNWINFFSIFFNKPKIIKLKINKNIKPRIYLNPKNGFFDKYIYVKKKWDTLNTKILLNKLKYNDCFIDVGSNIGYFSLIASEKIKNNGKVIAFEPIKKIYKQILFNKKINNCKNIKIYNCGCSNKNSKKEIFLQKKNIASSSINKKKVLNFSFYKGKIFQKLFEKRNQLKTESIKLCKLDNVIKEKVDFVKIDIEGHEYEALQGFKKKIKKYKPKLIIEINNISLKKNYSEKIYKFLKNLNYDIYFNFNLNKKISLKKFNKISNNDIVDIYCE